MGMINTLFNLKTVAEQCGISRAKLVEDLLEKRLLVRNRAYRNLVVTDGARNTGLIATEPSDRHADYLKPMLTRKGLHEVRSWYIG